VKPRDRVRAALNHASPDFTPCDYYATPEIHRSLLAYFGIEGDEGHAVSMGPSANLIEDGRVGERLGTDIRYISAPYVGPALPAFEDGSTMNLWGIRRRAVKNEYGDYAEPVNAPYAAWKTVEEVTWFPWPNPDWFDYSALPALCAKYPDLAIAVGGWHVQDFINSTALGRGVERTLLDIATDNPVFLAIIENRHRFYMAYVERVLQAARGRIDIVCCGDDFGTQRGLLISPASFDRLFAAKKKELFDLAHAYDAKVSHHCCGSSRKLIPHFIQCGMDAIQTIQTRAAGMDPYGLKKDFGGQIVLHGAVDVQGWLQQSSPPAIEAEVNRLMDEVGAGGGFILAPSHCIQPDTPLENVLAIYHTVAKRRKTQTS
jgi:uroporphyrinogen decarboxylase